MDFIVHASTLSGVISIPSSKSHTLRAILFASLASGSSIISNYLSSPDTHAMIETCKLIGAEIVTQDQQLLITGVNGKVNPQASHIVDVGNSGLVLRLMSAVMALGTQPITITGDDSIRYGRPMKTLIKALNELQCTVISTMNNHYAPLIVRGPLKGGAVTIDGADSQNVSAMLLASAFGKTPITINVENPGEKPWVDLTLGWFDKLGIFYERQDYTKFHLPGNSRIQGFQYNVPGDWSSAAFPIVAALITGSEITIQNVDIHDSQGDKKLLSILQQMGAQIEINEALNTVLIKKSELHGMTIDVNDCIDALPILTVLGCYAKGETRLVNGAVARTKECDRIMGIARELQKMGGNVQEHSDGLTIKQTPLFGNSIFLNSHEDHRIAMSIAVAGLGAIGKVHIKSVKCVKKTYSSFADDFQKLGADIITI